MTSASDEALWSAYRATLFEACTPSGRICIRVGQHEPALDDLLAQYGAEAWVFVTASNPASAHLDAAENRARNEELKRCLESLALPAWYRGAGRSPTGAWDPEESVLALGIEREDALRLGRRFGQNAVVWGRVGSVAELVDCR